MKAQSHLPLLKAETQLCTENAHIVARCFLSDPRDTQYQPYLTILDRFRENPGS